MSREALVSPTAFLCSTGPSAPRRLPEEVTPCGAESHLSLPQSPPPPRSLQGMRKKVQALLISSTLCQETEFSSASRNRQPILFGKRLHLWARLKPVVTPRFPLPEGVCFVLLSTGPGSRQASSDRCFLSLHFPVE